MTMKDEQFEEKKNGQNFMSLFFNYGNNIQNVHKQFFKNWGYTHLNYQQVQSKLKDS